MSPRRALLALPILALSGAGLLILENNFSWSRPSRAEFLRRLDFAQSFSRDWITGRHFASRESSSRRTYDLLSNPALLHMLIDSGRMSGDADLRSFETLPFERRNASCWARLLDPARPFEPPTDEYARSIQDYQRFMLHALAPGEFQLSSAEKAAMYSPDLFHRGRLTHQLIALYLYRRLNGSAPDLDRLIGRLAERIASEAVYDFRVTDLYLQRIVCLLLAGSPDLLKPRWVLRALNAQQPDGGWTYAWYGWQPEVFRFRPPEEESLAHPTAQGVWIIHLLKYRHREWIERNFE